MATDEQRAAFGDALRRAYGAAGTTQQRLAVDVSEEGVVGAISQPYLNDILKGRREPKPELAFAFERALGLQPGSLSRLLGFVPADALPARDVPAAVEADPMLDERGRRSLIAAYRALVKR